MLIEGERGEYGSGSLVERSGDDSDLHGHEMTNEKDDDYDMRSAGREI